MQDKWAAYVDIEMGLTKEAQNCGGWSSMGAGGKEGFGQAAGLMRVHGLHWQESAHLQ